MFATDGRGQDASAPDAPLPQLVGEWWLKPTLRAKTEIQQTLRFFKCQVKKCSQVYLMLQHWMVAESNIGHEDKDRVDSMHFARRGAPTFPCNTLLPFLPPARGNDSGATTIFSHKLCLLLVAPWLPWQLSKHCLVAPLQSVLGSGLPPL